MSRDTHVRRKMAGLALVALPMWIVGVASSPAQPAGDERVDLPDSPAGRCAAAYLEAFNTGADEMRQFIRRNRKASYLEKHPIDQIIERYRVLHEAAGGLTPTRLLESSDHKVRLLARTSHRQVHLELKFVVEERPPHSLVVFTLQRTDPGAAEADAVPIDDEIIKATTEAVAEILTERYVYPEEGEKMSEMLLHNESTKRYAGIRVGSTFAERITEDLQAVSRDRHLSIHHGKPPQERSKPAAAPPRASKPGAKAQIEWPDTPAGRQAKAYFDVYNTGSDDDLRRFITEHFSDLALEERSPEDSFALHSRMRSMAGKVTFHSAKADGPFSVLVSVNAAKTGWARLLIEVSPKPPHGLMSFDDMTPTADDARANYGFRKVEVLPDNIGYVRFDQCHHSEEALEAAAAALAFVANCDALIFDVRHNGGGTRHITQFIGGYLFDHAVHIVGKYSRLTDTVTEWSTFEEIPGRRFRPDLPVYILTSPMTFSAAETFAYCLQDLKRAIVVGETTGGGAHPVHERKVNDRFWMRLPSGRAISPVTKTDWEGVGVIPDIKVPASESLEAAVADAMKRIRRD